MEGSALTHLDAAGRARMVDVSEKVATERYARARTLSLHDALPIDRKSVV